MSNSFLLLLAFDPSLLNNAFVVVSSSFQWPQSVFVIVGGRVDVLTSYSSMAGYRHRGISKVCPYTRVQSGSRYSLACVYSQLLRASPLAGCVKQSRQCVSSPFSLFSVDRKFRLLVAFIVSLHRRVCSPKHPLLTNSRQGCPPSRRSWYVSGSSALETLIPYTQSSGLSTGA